MQLAVDVSIREAEGKNKPRDVAIDMIANVLEVLVPLGAREVESHLLFPQYARVIVDERNGLVFHHIVRVVLTPLAIATLPCPE